MRFLRTCAIFAAVAVCGPAIGQTYLQEKTTNAGKWLGTAPTQRLGIHGATPTAQRASAAQAALSVLTAASNTLTFDDQPEDSETLTIGATTYTYESALTVEPVANEILIGANVAATLANTVAAVNAAAGAGTTYSTGTTANASASAAAGTGSTIVFTAKSAGAAGNSIASTETSDELSFPTATFTGGADAASTAEIITLVNELRASLVEKGLIKGAAP